MPRALRLVLAFALVLVFLPSLADAGKERRMSAKHKKTLRALERCDCPGIFAPVCGADGNTWINACEARCRGVRSESGACEPPECVGDDASSCDAGLYCETAPGCGAHAPGSCEEPPVACTEEFAPVCGCDGVTYGNDCERAAAGVRLDFEGDCDERPVECRSAEDCDEGQFCTRPIGVCGSQPGVCGEPVVNCTDIYDPVCGCDNETYGNGCVAFAAGVNVAHEGECELAPPEDCRHDRDCEVNEFCRKAEGECDGKGTCEARPEVCPLVIDRVCGCDGEIYDNECAAASAGVSVDDDEACRDDDVPVCHRPPGNPGNKHTIYIGESAVSAHLRHGDWRGPCER